MKATQTNVSNTIRFLFIFFTLLTLNACRQNDGKTQPQVATNLEAPDEMVPKSWIDNRVHKASEKLQKTAAGKIVWQAMEAHGGLKKYYENGYLSFHFNYQPLGEGVPRNTYQVVDTWRNLARHKEALDTSLQYGWNGKVAWEVKKDSTSIPYNTRFWALTPYYFAAIPFVLEGAGVNLEQLPDENFKNKTWDVVKVTFDPGTGDAPDDYYILYFDKTDHTLGVIRYIVSYPAYFKKGEHMPEKFMDVIGKQVIDSIVFPEAYKTYWLGKDNQPTQYITEITLSEVSFENSVPTGYFNPPPGAKIIEGLE
ncbi:MAG: hypothetical protein RQ735_08070 [Flavobacteriaceae bacterium]|nr:hypothetical protein [Flavobacteriaceae bacterium]